MVNIEDIVDEGGQEVEEIEEKEVGVVKKKAKLEHQQQQNDSLINDEELMEMAMDLEEDLDYELPDSGQSRVIFSYGRTVAESEWTKKTPANNKIIPVQYYDAENAFKAPYKYMSARVTESNQAVNAFLDGHIYAIKSRCRDISDSENQSSSSEEKTAEEEELRNIITDLADEETLMTRLTEKTATETYYVGRIRYEGTKGGGLNAKNVFIESSTAFNEGDIVPLDLSLFRDKPAHESALPMAIFPGAIVLFKGQNPTGSLITVSRFIDLGELFKGAADFGRKCPPALLASSSEAEPAQPVSIVCASGPFVSSEGESVKDLKLTNTDYIKALASYVKKANPDFLLIFGPAFLEAEKATLLTEWTIMQSITTPSSDQPSRTLTSERLFNHQLRTLKKELEGRRLRTQILFIPSSDECPSVVETSLVYPTVVGNDRKLPGFQYFANPAVLSLGGIALGLTATDVLRHIGRHELTNISANVSDQKKGDRLKRLCSHLIEHKHFYPLLPAEKGVNIEFSQYDKLDMPVTPHLLILPSMLRPFVYNVEKTIVVNPGKANKNCIARILIDPVTFSSSFGGSISQYVNVEVIKLI